MFFATSVAMTVYSVQWTELKDLVELSATSFGIDVGFALRLFSLDVLIPLTRAASVSESLKVLRLCDDWF